MVATVGGVEPQAVVADAEPHRRHGGMTLVGYGGDRCWTAGFVEEAQDVEAGVIHATHDATSTELEVQRSPGLVRVPVRNVSPAPNERDHAGQTGKSPMASL